MNIIKSIPNKKLTNYLRVVYFFFFAYFINLIITLPMIFYESDQWLRINFIMLVIISFGLSALIWWYVFKVVTSKKFFKSQICSYSVDDLGFHYHLFGGGKRSILFNQLNHDLNRSNPDIYIVNYTKLPSSLYVHINNINTNKVIVEKLYFQLGGFFGEYVIKNSHELACEFFKRVHQHRPDITVAPEIYYQFNIHPEHFNFDHDAYHAKRKNRIWVLGVIILFLICIFLFIYYKHHFTHSI
ncbi:hypothetical protein ACG94M_21370 [Acinetobacter guillouiae]|uniref:hypothetical protein n=1 Tax=Acinetobacter guillouiae TaxID=106649 RepID=UPI003AF55A66